MQHLNSKFTTSQLQIILSKNQKFRLYYAVLFKYYQLNKDFFVKPPKISGSLLTRLACKLRLQSGKMLIPSDRTVRLYKSSIMQYFDDLQTQKLSKEKISHHLQIIIHSEGVFDSESLTERVFAYMNDHQIASFSQATLQRIIKSALSQYEKQLFKTIARDLSNESKAYLDGLLISHPSGGSWMNHISRWMRGIKAEDVDTEVQKLEFLKSLNYPRALVTLNPKHLKRYYRQIISKYPSAIKEMPESNRYALLIIFCFIKKAEINDNLIELLINTIHKIFSRGDNRSQAKLSQIKTIKKSYNYKKVLKSLLEVICDDENKEEIIKKQDIYSKLPEGKLRLIKEEISDDSYENFDDLSYDHSRRIFANYYRRIIAPIISILEFDSSSQKELLEAINLIKANIKLTNKYYKEEALIDFRKLLKKTHKNKILNDKNRLKRIDFELCVIYKLRNKLRIREVWIEGGHKYRNPEDDLPTDFAKNKSRYFKLLNQPVNSEKFILELRDDLQQSLTLLNEQLPSNKDVEIITSPKTRIKVAKIKEQAPPQKLDLIKSKVFERWPSTSLLDILKEADFFTNFLDDFVVNGSKVILDRQEINKRLLLIILGYGTNTGLKSMCNEEVSYQDLQYIKLRYFTPDNLQMAIRKVADNLLKIRFTELWGGATTSVASDSKHFEVSKQNLLSSWHPRYKSNGVLIYWHVDTGSLCIHSQLKGCNSSEVAAMLEGILRHGTKAEVNKNYVDTHGASEVGFAFAYLFGFELMPRFKNIHTQRLYYASSNDLASYSNLKAIMARPINWQLITKHYEYIIQHAISLRLGIADTATMLRKFTRDNLQHEAYRAIRELGRAVKTIFLCKYFNSLELRQEINTGLNIVERWNGVNDFIFYGKTGILRNNNPLELKLSMLSLHLLQISMVYINTLMLQEVVVEDNWLNKMELADKRAISPLINEHINPYGRFDLDLSKRLPLKFDSPVFGGLAA